MGFFRKLAVGFKRTFSSNSLSLLTQEKQYGNNAEYDFNDEIKKSLPGCKIKTNVLVETKSGRCEIDCLLEYQGKLYIIEIKHWKGVLIEEGEVFVSKKKDKYSDDVFTKEMKSPFLQVKRQASLLKEATNSTMWINTIVYFSEADEVNVVSDNLWFDNIDDLIDFIKDDGRPSNIYESSMCFNKAIEADYIFSPSSFGERSLHCIINEDSLNIKCTDGTKVSKYQIRRIDVTHHFSFDDISITLRNGQKKAATEENRKIIVKEDGINHSYSLAKIETIVIGN